MEIKIARIVEDIISADDKDHRLCDWKCKYLSLDYDCSLFQLQLETNEKDDPLRCDECLGCEARYLQLEGRIT